MDRKHRGALSELVACAWLLGRGYEVFRNVSQHGHIDMIAMKGPKIVYIDVKSNARDIRGYLRRTPPPDGLTYILVDPAGGIEVIPADAL